MTAPITDLDRAAIRAAWKSLPATALATEADVAAALRAAQAVYDADREAYVQRQVDEAQLAGMRPTEEGMEIRLVMARETAAHLVMAAKMYLDSTGAENYVEQAVTDRETGERYLITFQRPGGKSPHELRREAEAELSRFKETAERFSDPTVTDRIARILTDAPKAAGCQWCTALKRRACPQHAAEALVDAIRAEHLVALTVEAADQIIRHARKEPAR